MIQHENVARQFRSPEIDDLLDLLAKKKKSAHQYAYRHKKNVKFYSIFRVLGDGSLEVAISGPDTKDLRFSLVGDSSGYLFQQSVGTMSEKSLETMNRALRGLAGRLVQPKPEGFSTKNWDGFYLWAVTPTDDVIPTFYEAVELDYMSPEFMALCLEWGVSIKKYTKQ